jgi:hypothetical protein
MSADGANATATAASLRPVWKAVTPTCQEFGAVVSELQSMQMVGEWSIFERGAHIPVTHMAFFKPPATVFLSELKEKDRRSAKEWEYISAAGVWLELGQAAMALARNWEDDMTPAAMAPMLALADKTFGVAREVLPMRGQYHHDIVQYIVEAARKIAFLVEHSHDAVHSLSHRTVRESLNQRLESEATKMLAKAHLGRAGGGGGAGSGNPGSGSSADGAVADAWGFSWKEMGLAEWLGDRPTGEGRSFRWRDMAATKYEVRAIWFGILDPPSIPFTTLARCWLLRCWS